MERQRTRFRADIRDVAGISTVASHASHRDDMAVVRLGHSWHEFFSKQEVRDRVDVEDIAKLFFRFMEDGSADTDTSVVDQHRRFSMILPNLLGQGTDLAGAGDIYFVKVRIWRYTQ